MEEAWWNLGIAATALLGWQVARKAWNFFGLALDINDDEPSMDLGRTPIHLNPDGNTEVVWTDRIDPARAVIVDIPLLPRVMSLRNEQLRFLTP